MNDYDYKQFWEHPSIKHMRMFRLPQLLDMIAAPWVLRLHENGLYCFGIKGDTEHFRSKIYPHQSVAQAIAWEETGDRWFGTEWKKNCDADGSELPEAMFNPNK